MSTSSRPTKTAVKGMSLMAAGGKNKSLEDALVKEDKLAPVMSVSRQSSAMSDVQSIAGTHFLHPFLTPVFTYSLTHSSYHSTTNNARGSRKDLCQIIARRYGKSIRNQGIVGINRHE